MESAHRKEVYKEKVTKETHKTGQTLKKELEPGLEITRGVTLHSFSWQNEARTVPPLKIPPVQHSEPWHRSTLQQKLADIRSKQSGCKERELDNLE